MRRVLSLPGLAASVWAIALAFLGLLAVMWHGRAWHPHFLPVTAMLALLIVSGLALLAAASWRIVRGPRRRRALASLVIGVAPLWFLAGFFLYGLATCTGPKIPMSPGIKMLEPLAESVMDLEARFRYPQWTYGEKVVMISPPMPEAEARSQVAAMDRHVRALEGRLGREIPGAIHWARGTLLGMQGRAFSGLCLGFAPGQEAPDAEGLAPTDRHEVAHCVLGDPCYGWLDPPAVLIEGWARANQGNDPVEQAYLARRHFEAGEGLTLRELVGPDWYDRHRWAAYDFGAPLVDFLIDRFGADRFLELYTTCSQETFESDCRRILGLDLDGLDAAYRADIDRQLERAGPIERRRLERLRLDPGVKADDWKAFLAEYFAAARPMFAPCPHSRLTVEWAGWSVDAQGRFYPDSIELRVLRSGEFASLRRRWPGGDVAYLASPRRSILARRSPGSPWQVEDESGRTPQQVYRRALARIDEFDSIGRGWPAFVRTFSEELRDRPREAMVVTRLERFSDGGRPRVRIRIEDRSPSPWVPWRTDEFVLAADDHFTVRSVQCEISVPKPMTYRSEFTYDRHEGLPVVQAVRTTNEAPGPSDWKVVERQFGPVPEEAFDPDRFLDGPQVTEARPGPREPSALERWYWLPLPIGALCLIGGAGLSCRPWWDCR